MKKNIGWRAIILVAVLGIMFTYMGVKDSIKLAKDPINMDTTDWGTLKAGDHVQITIDMIWGQVYTETTEENTFGITTDSRESGRGYAIPHLYVDNQGFYNIDYYIGLRISNQNDYRVIEQILAESDAWYYDTTGTVDYGMTTMYIDGTLEKMDSEEKELMRSYLIGCGYTNSEVDRIMCPYMITKGNPTAAKVSLTIGIVFDVILLGIIGFFLYQNKKEKDQFAGQTYMGVSQTGTTDIYGGSNYGGNNFGGTDYGASNRYNNTYDGSTYGDTSYGGTNTYGQNSTYGATDTYGQESTYGGTNTYGQSSSYGATDTYGQGSTYGATDTYGQSSSYGATDTYGQNNSYGVQEPTNNDWPWQPKQ